MDIDSILWFACSATEVAVFLLLVYRRIWRGLPYFFAYSLWTWASNVGGFVVLRAYGPRSFLYVNSYLSILIVDSFLAFAVLTELAWSVLRPAQFSLPRRILWIIAALIVLTGVAVWPVVSIPGSQSLPSDVSVVWHLQQTVSVLQILMCLVLAVGSQLLAIGWRDRELQVATGFGFFSLVDVIIAALHTHQTSDAQYSLLNRFGVASYLCSLIYWIVCFAQKEQERRAMSPQMQSILLAVAGAARSTRIALSEQQDGNSKGSRNP